MRRQERIPIHDHSDLNSGGRVAQSTIVAVLDTGNGGTGSTIAALDDIPNVDVPSPSDGDALTFDSGTNTWIAAAAAGGTGTPSSSVTDETTWGITPAAGTATTYSRGDHTHGSPADPGSGAFTHAYVGYNTVGGSTESMITRRQYMKKVTLADDCLVTSIGAYIKQNSTNKVVGMAVGVLTDNAGSPELVIATGANDTSLNSGFYATNTGSLGAARWIHAPIGVWLVAGDFWLSVEFEVQTTGDYVIYYDGSGGDRYFTNNALRISDSGWTTVTTSSNKYSIRASTIS